MSSDKLELFPIRFTGKNYYAWEFQFKLFVKGKELWGHIDGSSPAPHNAEALFKREIKDARVMTWILSSVEPHLVLNLRPYKTIAAVWNYLHTVYNQDNSARHFQLEYEMTNFTQGSLSIEEYFSSFQTLWTEYSDIVYVNVPVATLSTVQAVHATSKRDQFLMKLQLDFEIARSNLMNRHPVPSLDACLSELLREEQRIVTQATMEHQANVSAPVSVAYAAHGRNKGQDMCAVQCFSCKDFGHIARDCPKKFCNYCKKQGHIISACPIRPKRKQGTTYHASTGASSSAALLAASLVVPIPTPTALANPNTLTPEMVQQMIIFAFSIFGLSSNHTVSSRPWYFDSEAFNHMTNTVLSLSKVRNYDRNLKINTADGSSLPISAVGDLSSSLTDVFVSLDLSTNLISVGQLVDNNCNINFSRSSYVVQDQVSGKMITKGPKVGRLFPLHVSPFTIIPSFPLLSFACNVVGLNIRCGIDILTTQTLMYFVLCLILDY
ncbi:hypothetical protein PVL29_022883 [Vitis rotundifolia]|uniref:CCHC-type domain-containing protein n=1 Tax=Vitis rotundifolia TaxID=103349 RepID=A0AA38YX28_VITRO|nr:hypothetical protein PVL29_022883 [Vitis rotundifolia]